MASKINFQLTANAKQWIAGLTAGQKALSQFANLQNKTVLATNTLTKGLGFYTKALIHNQKITLRAAGGLKAYADAIKKTTFTIKSRTNAGATMFRNLQREANANNKVTRSVERQNAAYAKMAARTRAGAMQTVPTRPVGFAPPAPATQGPPSAPAGSIRAGEINAATKGLRTYQGQAKRTTVANQKLGGSFGNLRFMLTGLFVGIGLHEFKKIADEAGQLNNRILVVSRSAEQFNEQFTKVTQIAKDTRADLRSTAVLYSRLSIATRRLGYDTNQVALATQNLSKMMAIQGVSQHEARSAVLQLSQALQSGRLAGDEFRAIQEIMPALLGDIARATGYPIEQLKDLAREGKITPKVIMDALLNNTEKINHMFENTRITVGQMGIQIRNSFVQIFAELQRNEGTAQALSDAYKGIARVFNILAQSIKLIVNLLVLLNLKFGEFTTGLEENHGMLGQMISAMIRFSLGLKVIQSETDKTKSTLELLEQAFISSNAQIELIIQGRVDEIEALKRLDEQYRNNAITMEEYKKKTNDIIIAMEESEQQAAAVNQAFQDLKTGLNLADLAHNIQSTVEQLKSTAFKTLIVDFPQQFGNSISDVIMSGNNLKDSMKKLFTQMAKQVIAQVVAIVTQLLIMKAVMASIGMGMGGNPLAGMGLAGVGMPIPGLGAGSFKGILGGVKSITKGVKFKKLGKIGGGLFADGGRPPIGQASVVGERGPELFVPDQAGTIIPNEQMGGGIVIQNLNIMPGANIDAALTEKPMTYWVDLTQEKILPALNTLGQAGNTTTLQTREPR